MLTIITAALSFVPGGKLATKLVVLVGAVLALLAAYGVWHHHVYTQGKEDTLNAIARNDAKIVAEGRKRRRLVVDCDAGGLRWDQSTGKCVGQ
jgi:hypothetical protein